MIEQQKIGMKHAAIEDLEEIVAIYNATIPGRQVTADLEPVTVAARLSWFEKHSPEKHPLWVIKSGGKVVAWLSLQPFYGRPAYEHTVEIGLYIAEHVRSQGLGSLLMQKAIDEAPYLHIHTLLGFVFAHNTPSLQFLRKFQFSQWGLLPNVAELDGQERDLVIMGRRVNEP